MKAALGLGCAIQQIGLKRDTGLKPIVTLHGYLRCANDDELAIVRAHIEEHIALTRAEEGCLTFEVSQSQDSLIWTVYEEFTDPDAFRFHQARVGQSAWGRATKGIARDYTVQGMD